MYYTYIYLDPRKPGKYQYDDICFLYEPFYVGKGKGDRYNYHIKSSRVDNQIFKNKINKIIKSNLDPYIERFKYTESEELAYYNETDTILQIGSFLIDGIKDGPLLNICLINQPPKLKGRSYKDIYGDRWEIEIEKRRVSIKENHRLHKRKHTEETKKKISISTSGSNNPRWGVVLSKEVKDKISKRAKERLKNVNPSWREWLVTSPFGEIYIVKNGLKSFCLDKNLSYSTLRKCLKTGLPVKSGRTMGWMLQEKK